MQRRQIWYPGMAPDWRVGAAKGSCGCLGQFGPDEIPIALAKHLPGQFAIGLKLDATSLLRSHVPAASQALVQVLLVDAVFARQLSTACGRNFYSHAHILA